MLFYVLARKTYVRNLQYRGAHLINTIASSLFGFIYMSIWAAIATDQPLGEYGSAGIVSYVAFNQCSLWVAAFLTNGLGIEQSVRTGGIALELMRPTHLFYQLMCKEWGQIAYQFVYKFLPIYALYAVVLPMYMPHSLKTWLATAVALLLAGYISICINYLIGATALWTTESRWLFWVNYAFNSLLSGFLIPLEWLPKPLAFIAHWSSYPSLNYIPTRIYLGLSSPSTLVRSVAWAVFLTICCLGLTKLMRRKVEVQGG
ncbi:ABC-2 type transport system permease protein [Paenibacillus cellulosilyticus]|uniref:ABC-2 type transport system permease protein n=1 Tax=Paenibacillus cellulosilyticus TaxID=375489 RepID=A0A2V2YPP1_9BACL|nr:ABC-2 family transporter protein [Paenibacillus cellulosilyticus]PWV98009.1 ABC-2 type transport system permease protein [Paenibacillus cellulosilyticus]QKS43966.1 ABC-2 family transporter protein [Paenibacillus cellulosilyticus]